MRDFRLVGVVVLLVLGAVTDCGQASGPGTGYWLEPHWQTSVLGDYSERIVVIEPGLRGLEAHRISIAYGRSHRRPRGDLWARATLRIEGPFAIDPDAHEFRSVDGPPEDHYTFRMDGRDLVMPALVRTGDGTWRYKRPTVWAVLQCGADPDSAPEIPTGGPVARWRACDQLYSFRIFEAANQRSLRLLRDNYRRGSCGLVRDERGKVRVTPDNCYLDIGETRLKPTTREIVEQKVTAALSNVVQWMLRGGDRDW